jgi:hypothetical protein
MAVEFAMNSLRTIPSYEASQKEADNCEVQNFEVE